MFNGSSTKQKTPNIYKRQIEQSYNLLNEKVMPKTQKVYLNLQTFYQTEISQFDKVLNQAGMVIDQFRSKSEQCEACINQIISKKNKDKQFTSKGQGYIHAKAQQIKSKVKNIDSVSTGIKEKVSKIKTQKLQKLPVDDDPDYKRILKNIFSTLYQVLYEGKQNQFIWKDFRDKALKSQDGEDFIFRLVNINFKELSPVNIDKLLMLKGDPEFENLCVGTKYSYDLLDLADWIEYVCVGYQFSEEKKKCQIQYNRIRKDIDKRQKGSLQMSQAFWKQAGQQLEVFQNSLTSAQSQIKGIVFGMNRSLQQINDAMSKRNLKIQQINAI